MSVTLHLEQLARDARLAIRGFARSPLFTATCILTMAFGIGAGTAVFSVVDRILFRSLPYPQADRLVSVGMMAPIVPQEFLLGYDYLYWRDRQTPFEALASWSGTGDCDLSETNPVRLRCAWVDAAFLSTLGIRPMIGRGFTRDEDRPGAPRVALISYGLWRSRFAGDYGVAGRGIPLDGRVTTIIGVLPREFELPSLETADVMLPQALDEAEQRIRKVATLVSAVGRLRRGVTQTQATGALQPLFQEALQFVSPEFRKEVKLRVRSLRDRQIEDVRLASWILAASVLCVLLIACANVANLLLARAAARQSEVAVRAALGAGRGSLVRQTLTESVLLGLGGGIAGCLLAFLLLRFFVGIAPEGVPRLQHAVIDMRVLLFTLSVSLISGALFGLAPALQNPSAEKLSLSRVLGRQRYLFRRVLTGAQIAVSLMLLSGAGLLLRSLWNLQTQPLGMRTGGVLTAAITLGEKAYADPIRRSAFFEELEGRLGRIPGVSNAALSDSLPPNHTTGMMYSGIDVEGRPRTADPTGGMVSVRSVTPNYFATLGIAILRGRTFQEADRDADQHVVIISDSMARRMFPGENPIGKQIKPGRVGPWLAIIGVAGNVKNSGLAARDDPEYYMVRKQRAPGTGRSAIGMVRAEIDLGAVAAALRKEVAEIDPVVPVRIESMERQVGRLAERPRFNALLLALFAAMGVLLAAVGVYGVVSSLVAQRTQEIGVRVALGATAGAIARLVLWHAARWAAAGAAVGLAGSLLAARALESMLFRVSARDPWIMGAAAVVLVMIALVAAWIPSRRASRIDPMQALRQE